MKIFERLVVFISGIALLVYGDGNGYSILGFVLVIASVLMIWQSQD